MRTGPLPSKRFLFPRLLPSLPFLMLLSFRFRSGLSWITSHHYRSTTTTIPTLRMAVAAGGGGGRISSAVSAPPQSPQQQQKAPSQQQKQQQPISTQPVKGTRDVPPMDMRLREWLFGHWRTVAAQFGFEPYDAPVLEHTELYTRKAGEDVTQQLYAFTDQGGRAVALRPEMTPSLARMVLRYACPLPLKWYAIPQCWRYERMTRGRRREHYQWNMDIWGVAGVTAEVELVAAMVMFLERVGLTCGDVGISVNSRLVIGQVLSELGIPAEKFAATCVLVDKLEKVPIEAVQGDLEALGLDRTVVEQLLSVLSAKNIDELRESLGEESPAIAQLNEFFGLCEHYGISDWVQLDASVVRGLSYYTGIVFEAFDRRGELRAIAGGGRYDELLNTYGAKQPIPAVGFGFGDAVIVELLKDRDLLPSFKATGVDTVVFSMNEALYPVSLQVASSLRTAGQKVDVILERKKPKWVFKHADRLGAKYCVVVGEDEYASGQVAIKDLTSGEQRPIDISSLTEWVEGEKSNKRDGDTH